MDDIIAIIPKNKVNETFNIFNSYHPRLKFTHELELNGTINFLDIKIIREGNNLLILIGTENLHFQADILTTLIQAIL